MSWLPKLRYNMYRNKGVARSDPRDRLTADAELFENASPMKPPAENLTTRLRQASWTWVLGCLAALGFLALIQTSAGETVSIAPLYALPIVLAAWFTGLSRGMAIALAALAAWLLGYPVDIVGSGLDTDLLNISVAALGYIGVAVLVSALRTATWRDLPDVGASDSLNGILLASQFRQVANLELAGAQRYARPLVCAYMELTGFRLVSDGEGPALAVALLAVLGRCMRRCLRRADIVGHLRADQFLVLLPDTAAAEATSVLEQLRREFLAASQPCGESIDLRIVLLSYPLSPLTVDDVLRDIKSVLRASRTEAGTRSVTLR